jgi:hypothetical protein
MLAFIPTRWNFEIAQTAHATSSHLSKSQTRTPQEAKLLLYTCIFVYNLLFLCDRPVSSSQPFTAPLPHAGSEHILYRGDVIQEQTTYTNRTLRNKLSTCCHGREHPTYRFILRQCRFHEFRTGFNPGVASRVGKDEGYHRICAIQGWHHKYCTLTSSVRPASQSHVRRLVANMANTAVQSRQSAARRIRA